ncbi:DUF2613 domain-containing protein [Nocardia sp. NPDC088792]|uniref:DUF2613 domain-containing protein n=1 Tax=Nocardia sp. NPDC088792 TaxID=3364332 RepID=UPI00381BE44B
MKFAVPGAASAVGGALVGLAAVLVITMAGSQDKRPDIDRSNQQGSSLLNNVEYGQR